MSFTRPLHRRSILETKRIGDWAQERGVSMALHSAGTPISTMASVHCAAATENFIALEHHFIDVPFWTIWLRSRPSRSSKVAISRCRIVQGWGSKINADALRST